MRAATPAPVDKLEKNGKEAEKEEDKEEGEAQSDKEKAKEKEKDEGKEVESSRTADPEEVGRRLQNSKNIYILWLSEAKDSALLKSLLLFFF